MHAPSDTTAKIMLRFLHDHGYAPSNFPSYLSDAFKHRIGIYGIKMGRMLGPAERDAAAEAKLIDTFAHCSMRPTVNIWYTFSFKTSLDAPEYEPSKEWMARQAKLNKLAWLSADYGLSSHGAGNMDELVSTALIARTNDNRGTLQDDDGDDDGDDDDDDDALREFDPFAPGNFSKVVDGLYRIVDRLQDIAIAYRMLAMARSKDGRKP